MRSAPDSAETHIMEAAIPSIRKLCLRKWHNLEYQDRVSEACRIFLEDLRTMPLNTGHFWEEFRADLEIKMGEINRCSPSIRFGHYSLDAVFSQRTGKTFEGYQLIPSTLTDFAKSEVDDFLLGLPLQARKILILSMKGYEPPEIAGMLDISIPQLNQEMEEIRRLFRLWNEE